jgi:hypothetical protein
MYGQGGSNGCSDDRGGVASGHERRWQPAGHAVVGGCGLPGPPSEPARDPLVQLVQPGRNKIYHHALNDPSQNQLSAVAVLSASAVAQALDAAPTHSGAGACEEDGGGEVGESVAYASVSGCFAESGMCPLHAAYRTRD